MTPLETIGARRVRAPGRRARLVARRSAASARSSTRSSRSPTRFGLDDVLDERTSSLPYGKQRLLEIAVAFACRPRVLLLDEPAAGVPEAERHELLATVAALPRRRLRAADRARHGPRLQLRRPHLRAGQRARSSPRARSRRSRPIRGCAPSISGRASMGDLLALAAGLGRLRRGHRDLRTSTCVSRAGRVARGARPQRHRQDDAAQHHHRRHPACAAARSRFAGRDLTAPRPEQRARSPASAGCRRSATSSSR